MLDLKFIKENIELVRAAIKNKKAKVDLDLLLRVAADRNALLVKIENLRQKRKQVASAHVKNQGEGVKIKTELQALESEMGKLELELQTLLRQVPNIPSDDTPIGPDESGNLVIRQHGQIPKWQFPPKEHDQLGQILDVIDTQTAAVVSGARFSYLKRGASLLEFALIQLALSILTSQTKLKAIAKKNGLKVSPRPFIPIVPPVFIRPEVMDQMGRLEPREERYYIPSDNQYLVGSAEHTLGPIHMNQSLPEKDLPIRYIGFSTAFRREAGSYGKDTKGIFRVHQFDKVEMESFCTPETSLTEQNFFIAIQEHLWQTLELPYRVMLICTGDMGMPDFRQVDIETWLPGQKRYRETHTADLMTDYQARRLKTKIALASGQTVYAHMNDATVVAIGRAIIAILENYQQADGSVKVPKALQKFLPGFKIIQPPM